MDKRIELEKLSHIAKEIKGRKNELQKVSREKFAIINNQFNYTSLEMKRDFLPRLKQIESSVQELTRKLEIMSSLLENHMIPIYEGLEENIRNAFSTEFVTELQQLFLKK